MSWIVGERPNPARNRVPLALGRVRGFLEAKVAPIANDCWARAEFPFDLIPQYGELGIAGLAHDECPGDKPRSLLTGFLAMDMARVDPSMATFFGVHAGLAMGSIGRCGSTEQRERWLPAMGRMEKIGAFALTEPDGGSDVALGLRTTARRDGDHWVLNGAKRWIGNATASLGMVVRLAQLQDEGLYRDEHSALAKAYCTSRMREAVGWARELMAGNGIVLDYGIGRFVADAEALYSYEGTREINTLIVGRAATGLGAFV